MSVLDVSFDVIFNITQQTRLQFNGPKRKQFSGFCLNLKNPANHSFNLVFIAKRNLQIGLDMVFKRDKFEHLQAV